VPAFDRRYPLIGRLAADAVLRDYAPQQKFRALHVEWARRKSTPRISTRKMI